MSEYFTCFDCLTTFTFNVTMSEINPEERKMKNNICTSCIEKIICKRKKEMENSKLPRVKNLYKLKTKQFKDDNDNMPKIDLSEETKLNADIELFKQELTTLTNEVTQCENTLLDLLQENVDVDNKLFDLQIKMNYLENEVFIEEKTFFFNALQKNTFSNQIKQFSNSHMLSDLFVITINSKLGIINGKRIGERIIDTKDIRDNETNAGLGYVMLLTTILAYKFNFVSVKYELLPGANYSRIAVKGSDIIYELIIPSGVKTFDKFNEGARAYSDYFAEFYNYLITTKQIILNKNDFQFIILKDCINGKSINLDINKIQDWTQCMKSLLTFLKYLITQVIINEDKQYKALMEKK